MGNPESRAFELLDPGVQEWIWKEGWSSLRSVQERAIGPVLEAKADVVIASATASGKTEAAFLPIASAAADHPGRGISTLYLSPLKALINDQFPRLESLFEHMHRPVFRWHGDVSSSHKRKALNNPRGGLLLITPESLEALFIRRGPELRNAFSSIQYLVVDELHAFIGTERGRQLQSLLTRVDLAARSRPTRVALSATIGDMKLARDFLRPGEAESVIEIRDEEERQEVKLQIRGYRHEPMSHGQGEDTRGRDEPAAHGPAGDTLDIARHLFRTLRGGRHIVFANRRRDVEVFADLLRRLAEDLGVPNEFWPHHGSLDKGVREDAEAALKGQSRPATLLATTTLELGIDVGSVESIGQIGPPPSVASLRQRLGRSGRRGEAAVIRIYVQEDEITPQTEPHEELRVGLVQSIAMVRLLQDRWYEPPIRGALHLSTLVQQTLSLIAEHGGVTARDAYRVLSEIGPFRNVDTSTFGSFLKSLGEHDLIQQTERGELVLGLSGERLVDHFEFYAAFFTPEEYRLVAEGKTLGTLPILYPVSAGMYLIFAGRRWKVVGVTERDRVIELIPAEGGRAPNFGGSGALVHDRVREEMRRVYERSDRPPYVDGEGLELLEEARSAYERFSLASNHMLQVGRDVLIFPWKGDRAMSTLALALRRCGRDVGMEGVAVRVLHASMDDVQGNLSSIRHALPIDLARLAQDVQNKGTEKHHHFLTAELLGRDFASARLDGEGLAEILCGTLRP